MARAFPLLLLPALLAAACSADPALAEGGGRGPEALSRPAVARAADDGEADSGRERRAARLAREREAERRFRAIGLVRGGIALAGFGVFGWGVWLRRRGVPDRAATIRISLLSLLAVASFAAYYNFFRASHPGGFKGADVYHYYMGSKYFEEIGYFELYHCTLAALLEDGRQDPHEIPPVRNQRDLRLQSREATLEGARECPRRFEPARWSEFKGDVAFFRGRILGASWSQLLEDHGYNPTPVWSFVGGLFSKRVAADSEGFGVLITLDRVLVVAIAGLLAWAFGIEAACLAALVWGASPLWSYDWIGDAFLRNLWLFCAVAGLCLLERGRALPAGGLLAASALLRLFPGAFAAGYFAHVLRHSPRAGVPAEARRFAIGVAAATAILLAGGAFGTGRGPGAYLEFREKVSGVVSQPGVNKVGLSALVGDLAYRATTHEVTVSSGRSVRLPEPAPLLVATLRAVQVAIVAAGLFAFWRGLRRVSAAEAAVLSFALIPLLTSPTNYYYPFVTFAAMLSPRRPWTGVALGVATLAWIAAAQIWFQEDLRHRASDAVAVIFSLVILFGVAFSRPPAPDSGPRASTTA
jgi:hypothetical protein